jgi:hypothetical protein
MWNEVKANRDFIIFHFFLGFSMTLNVCVLENTINCLLKETALIISSAAFKSSNPVFIAVHSLLTHRRRIGAWVGWLI